MILSFHPCYEADTNILCAGRNPDQADLAAIRRADAVVLPQGCREALYRLARQNNPNVFPNYDVRFEYPGKTGQSRLFQTLEVPHPDTWIFEDTAQFGRTGRVGSEISLPLVFKLDWGGEGETVFPIQAPTDLERALALAAAHERSGQRGFVLQTLVPHDNRTLRVVVIGETLTAYWRIQENPAEFGTSVGHGARIDTEADPDLRLRALTLVRRFCHQTRINLAGFDLIFRDAGSANDAPQPLFLEINYFFGRTGLGGSTRFYGLLQKEIDRWLADLGLSKKPTGKG